MDAEKLKPFIEQQRRMLMSLARRKGLNAAVAEDFAQGVIAAACHKLSDERDIVDEGAWIRAFAERRLMHEYRASFRQRRLLGEAVQVAEARRGVNEGQAADLGSVRSCLSRLEHRERVAIWLTEIAALTHEETAGVMGFASKTSISQLLGRARAKLDRALSGGGS